MTSRSPVASACVLGLRVTIGCAALVGAAVSATPARADVGTTGAALAGVVTEQQLAGGIAATRSGGTLALFSAGDSDVDTRAGFSLHTRFRAASVTKTFVAATVLQLVAEGKIDLDASVERYLPGRIRGEGIDAAAITVRQLLHNASGLPEYYYDTDPHGPPQTPEQLLTLALTKPAQFPPGAMIKYTNTNFVVAGLIIAAATGRPAAEEVTRRIITPLGLTDSYFPVAGETTLRAPFAHGYELLGGRYLPGPDPSVAAVPPDTAAPIGPRVDVTDYEPSNSDMTGALVSTGADLTTFISALLAGRVVPPAQLHQMMDAAPWPEQGPDRGYGLGLMSIALRCGITVWGHGGDLYGYHTLLVKSVDGPALSVTFNQAGADPSDDPRDRVLDALYCPHDT